MPVNQVFDYLPRKSDKTKQVNFTIAIYICREYLRNKRNLSPPDVINLIEKHVLPVRPCLLYTSSLENGKLISKLLLLFECHIRHHSNLYIPVPVSYTHLGCL